jgi:Multiubiquitin
VSIEATELPIVEFDIHIDRKPYVISRDEMTGAELRHLAGLPDNVDLYREEEGDIEDELIGDGDLVKLRPGLHFYSTPSHVTPGRA